MARFVQKLLTCSGPLVRIGPTDLLTGDVEVIRRITAVRSPYTRSDWYLGTRVDPPKDPVFSERDEAVHSELRNILSPGVRMPMSMMIGHTLTNGRPWTSTPEKIFPA